MLEHLDSGFGRTMRVVRLSLSSSMKGTLLICMLVCKDFMRLICITLQPQNTEAALAQIESSEEDALDTLTASNALDSAYT